MLEFFIPGKWQDDIDVTDFLNLNKKPFFEEPLFLKNSSEQTEKLFAFIQQELEKEVWSVMPEVSTLRDTNDPYAKKEQGHLPGLLFSRTEKRIGITENIQDIVMFYNFLRNPSTQPNRKSPYHVFEEVITSESRKMLKSDLFKGMPTDHTPSYVHPDIRVIALYGTKKIIEDKKHYLKTHEKHLQTQEWIEKRIIIRREMEALREFEKFAKKYKLDVTKPATSAKEAFQKIYITLVACVLENPSVPFSFTNVLSFLDTFIELDLQQKKVTEETVQEMIDELYLKLSLLRFIHSPKLAMAYEHYPHYGGETFGGGYVTKTHYRFLHAMKRFNLSPFAIRIIWDQNLPKPFKEFVVDLLDRNYPLYLVNPRILKQNGEYALYQNGMFGLVGKEVIFNAGYCDLEKVLYLALNGGKDIETNTNLYPVTQPTRTNDLKYEQVMAKFKDYFSYVLSSYAEIMNVAIYLNEVNHNHSIRMALVSNFALYKVQFGFSNLKKVVSTISAIQSGQYTLERDEKGWVKAIRPTSKKIADYDIIMAHIITYIEAEIKKIPLYKNGKAMIRMKQTGKDEIITVHDLHQVWTLPPEYSHATFQVNVQIEEDVISFVEKAFESDLSEISLTKGTKRYLVDGVLFDRTVPTLLQE